MIEQLAINGGTPVRTTPFPAYRTIGAEEKNAVAEVMDSGVLSSFLGTWAPDFFGGPRVQKLEREWEDYFGVAHAVSMNSATSGLYAALGAAGIGPGDEVIVSPYTMSASAVGPLIYNAIPVFADIDPGIFCLTAETIRARLTPRTRAVIVVDIFGHPAEMDAIMALAAEHGLVVIEDCAQAPGARMGNRYAGTLAHMGVFSLNYHKHIHSGEGALVVTDDPQLAERLQLIRNHAEVVLQKKGETPDLNNMLGFNYRMTELEAAIASEQLKKLEGLLGARVARADQLTELLSDVPGIRTPVVKSGFTHAFYLYVLRYDADQIGVSRADFVKALAAEGIPFVEAYVEPIYLQPIYQQRILFGGTGSPWTDSSYTGTVSYDPGICPVTEQMYYRDLMFTNVIHAQTSEKDVEDIAAAIHKVVRYFRSGKS
jgi:perosamine synthetase